MPCCCGYYTDTQEWDGNQWRLLAPADHPPHSIRGAMVFDAVRRVCVLFNGQTWELSLTPTVPANRTELLGVELFSQCAVTSPGASAVGIILDNAGHMLIGNQ